MVSGTDVTLNLKRAELLIRKAVAGGAQLVLLPENFALFDSQQLFTLAKEERANNHVAYWLEGLSKELGVWLFAGSFPMLGKDLTVEKVRSSLLVFNPQGQCVARYDKRHLFDVDVSDSQGAYLESAYIEPGDELVVVETEMGKVGLSICYDLRFPKHFWALRELGADIIVVPSAFTKVTGEAHWEVLLRARAVETQCYILGANQGGQHSPSRETSGDSMIIDPWGAILSRCDVGEGIAVSELDADLLNTVRSRMPVLSQQR
jgi:nitrilase